MADLSGQDLGRYHILEQIGKGGMATVYKAYDAQLERNVAVKVIRRDALPPQHLDRILKRFRREAHILASLSHPNIVKVLDFGEFENTPYLVLEFQPSGTLRSKLVRPIPWQEAVILLAPIASALNYAHRAHVVHRDVKPANILISSDGRPMLTDFGIAKLLETERKGTLSTGTGVGVGTPEYMAPEQGLGKNVDARADIYALGVVFYEMITGRKPFKADTPMAIVVKQINEPLPLPSEYVQDLPDFVERFLMKALAKRPQDRFQNMGQVVKAMERMPRQKGGLARHAHGGVRASLLVSTGTNGSGSDAATGLFEQTPRKGRGITLAIGIASITILIAGVVVGPKILAASSANVSRASFSKATVAAAEVDIAATGALAASSASTRTLEPASTPESTQTPAALQSTNVTPSPTNLPGSISMSYGTSANGRTRGVYAFNAKKGDVVSIAVSPGTSVGKNIYCRVTLKNGLGETLAVGTDFILAYTGNRYKGIVNAGSRIEHYVIPNDGTYYIDAGLSPRGVPTGYFVVVLTKLEQ